MQLAGVNALDVELLSSRIERFAVVEHQSTKQSAC